MKRLTFSLKQFNLPEYSKRFLCYCFSLLLNSTSLALSSEYFELICIIFLSERLCKIVSDAKLKLKAALLERPDTLEALKKTFSLHNIEHLFSEHNSKEIQQQIFHERETEQVPVEFEQEFSFEFNQNMDQNSDKKSKTLKYNSPFTKHFESIKENVLIKIKDSFVHNLFIKHKVPKNSLPHKYIINNFNVIDGYCKKYIETISFSKNSKKRNHKDLDIENDDSNKYTATDNWHKSRHSFPILNEQNKNAASMGFQKTVDIEQVENSCFIKKKTKLNNRSNRALKNTSTQLASSQQASTQLASSQPASTQLASSQPASTQQASTQQASTQPASTQPASTQLASTQLASTQLASTQPASTQLASTQLASTQLASSQQGSTQQYSTQLASTQQAAEEDYRAAFLVNVVDDPLIYDFKCNRMKRLIEEVDINMRPWGTKMIKAYERLVSEDYLFSMFDEDAKFAIKSIYTTSIFKK